MNSACKQTLNVAELKLFTTEEWARIPPQGLEKELRILTELKSQSPITGSVWLQLLQLKMAKPFTESKETVTFYI